MTDPSARREAHRLAALHRYGILDTAPEEAFDRITRLVTHVFGVPIALITFVDTDRQWFKSRVGIDAQQARRKGGFCDHTIRGEEVMVVEDAVQDRRFEVHPLVTGDPGIRFYAGAPLITPGGHLLGSLCAIDTEARCFSDAECELLSDMAAMVVDELELRSAHRQYERVLESITDAFFAVDRSWCYTYVNERAEQILGHTREELLGRNIWEVFPEAAEFPFYEAYHRAMWEQESVDLEAYFPPMKAWFRLHAYPFADGLSVYFDDITERKAREEELRRQRDLLHQAQRIAGGWEVDLVQNKMHWSEQVYAVYELPVDTELSVEQAIEFYAPEGRPVIQAAVEAAIEDGTPWDLELPLITAAGRRRWVRAVGAAYRDERGRVVRLAGAFQDITVQKQAEREVKRERDLLEKIFDASPAAIVMLDAEGNFTRASTRAQEVLGLEPSAIQTRAFNSPAWKVTSPHGGPIPDDELPFSQVMRTGRPVYDIEHGIVWPDGTRRLLSVSGAPLQTEDERTPMGAVFVLDDITERRRTERHIRLQAKALEASADAMVMADDEGRINWINPAFTSLTGYTAEETVGQPLSLLRSDVHQPAFYDGIWTHIRSGHVWHGELMSQRKNGSYYNEEMTITPVTDKAGRVHHYIALKRDVTEQRRHQQALVAAKQQAEEMSRLKSSFLANMSHEIRTPLTSIIGFAEVLAGMELGEPADEFAGIIEHGGRRLLATLNSVLDLSQLEARAIKLRPKPVMGATLVENVVKSFLPQAINGEVELCLDVPGDPRLVTLDPDALQRVVSNLVSNAIKFTPAGGRVTVDLREEADGVMLRVQDTGVGIGEAFLPALFEAFKQESTGEARRFEGAGLGLAITKQLIDLMGGAVNVESRKGEGTVFTVVLPA